MSLLSLLFPIHAQEVGPAQVMILGTYHFANPGLDVAQFSTADILSDEKQQEVSAVVVSLASWKPTKVAIERKKERKVQVDSLYLAFWEDRHKLGPGEEEQLGFRLARRFAHPKLYCIDQPGSFPIQEVFDYVGQHDPTAMTYFTDAIMKVEKQMDSLQRNSTVTEILRFENDPERIRWGHSLYVRAAGVAADDTKVGARLLTAWYERNIGIFSNLKAIAVPGDRILVIFGAGHSAILRELVQADPTMELVDPLDFLGDN